MGLSNDALNPHGIALHHGTPQSPMCDSTPSDDARPPSASALDHAAPEQHTQNPPCPRPPLTPPAAHHAAQQAHLDVDENDCTPRSEVPSVPDALNTALLSHAHTVDPEPSYFSPQPLRIYSSPIPHSTPTSSNPSPSTSTHASQASLANPDDAAAATAARSSAPPPPQQHPGRPAFMRDLSSASTASNTTVRANSVDPIYPYAAPPRQRDGPVYPNQSYAALHLQKYPQPYVPPIVRSRSSHPAHAAANSLSSLGAFGLTYDHFRDIMDSGPRTVGNSPVSTPGLFNPANRRMSQDTDATDDGTYSTPWLHHTHRQAPKETHIADVQADPVSGRKIVNQYEIIDELGRGVHGKVKLGKDLVHGRYVAIKIVDRYSKRRRLGKNNSHEDKIKREIAILKKARHPNIVSLLEVIDDPAKKKVYIVLEHVELGEVKWRTEGAKEICLVEWRRFKRESQGVFDNDSAAREDENIIRIAHQKLARQQRRAARAAHLRRKEDDSDLAWSLEMGMDSEDDYSENGRGSQSSSHTEELLRSQVHFRERQQDPGSYHDDHMETAFRSPEPNRDSWAAGLEGTMYGPYDSDFTRGRAPSLADSSSSRVTDPDEEIPEHFNYVPLMTTQAAWEAFKDTVLGIEYLHYQNVIHRDIKPANLLVTREHRIKISDFGVSYLGRQKTDEANGDQSETEQQEADEAIELAKTVGTPAFYAPELCRTETDAETPLIDGGIDIWALGVTLYCLIYGRVPFHDTNTFTLMKVISEDEPYIPRYRLKPVAEHSTSRPSSHGRNTQPVSSKRAPHDLEYEEVDENLRDLLRRLLVKDARHRITIPEIKRHPWVLSGIPNHISWAEETDPSRSFEGRKIQISKEDVDEAVVPIGFVDRLRFAAKKTSDFVKGFTTRSSGSRRRAQSSAANHDTPNISANSSSSTISQDARPQEGRRGSLAPGAILEILTRSRESEHPLSHSVTASPEARERSKYFDSPSSRTASPAQHTESYQRPPMQDRAISSISTIRQSDMHGRSASPVISPALPGTPTALDTPGGSQLGGLFGGLPRRVVNSMRSRDRLKPPKEHSRARSIDRLVGCEEDGHAVPSLAISTTCASGQVNQPDVLKEASSPVARTASPANSEAQSFSNIDASSRQSSLSSMSSRLRRNWAAANDIEVGPSLGIASESRAVLHWPQSSSRRPSSTASVAQEQAEETFDRAKDEYRRRLGVEQSIARERSNSAAQRPPSSLSQAACPPSPDDEIPFNQQSNQEYWHRNDQSSENSPLGGSSRGLALSSSEDQFSAMSQSESNPSIPSVASVGSPSQGPCASFDDDSWITSSTVRSFPSNEFESPTDDASGYDGDHAVESDEDDDSEEEGLMMGFARKKVPAHKTNRSSSVSNGELARSAIHLGMNTRRRSNRSGSNGTVKKIPPPEPTPVHEQASESH